MFASQPVVAKARLAIPFPMALDNFSSFLQLSFSHIFEIVYCESEQFRNKATKLAVRVPMEIFFLSQSALDVYCFIIWSTRARTSNATLKITHTCLLSPITEITFLRNGRMKQTNGSLLRWENTQSRASKHYYWVKTFLQLFSSQIPSIH